MTQVNSPKKTGKELSFIQKCIVLANIFQDPNKCVINPFNSISYVKLYTANLTDEKFIYSNIKGALLLISEKNKDTTNLFLQIYDIDNYSIVFNMPITPKLIEEKECEEKFIKISTRQYCIGFKFSSILSMRNFLIAITNIQPICDINEKAKQFTCENSEMKKAIKSIKGDLEKKLKSIDKESDKVKKDKYSFHKLDELYRLVNCIEYSELNNKINIFIDKTMNPFTIKSYIDTYKNTKDKEALPYKIVFNDYNQIKNKKDYVGFLVKNLINNFQEEKKLIVFKREHKKRHAKEEYAKNNIDMRNSASIPRPKFNLDDKTRSKTKIQSNMNPIEEEA